MDGKMNIFQKDGKGENIPKIKTQLRTEKKINNQYYKNKGGLNRI